MPARETSGGSGTSTPRIVMRSGTGFHSVCHERCSSLCWKRKSADVPRVMLTLLDCVIKSGNAVGINSRARGPGTFVGKDLFTHQTTAPRVKTILKWLTNRTWKRKFSKASTDSDDMYCSKRRGSTRRVVRPQRRT